MLRRYVLVLMLGGHPHRLLCSERRYRPSSSEYRWARNRHRRDGREQDRLIRKPSVGCNDGGLRFATGQRRPAGPPTKDASSRLADKSFDDIKFEMEVGDPFDRKLLTSEIEALHGRRIRIRGYILPTATKRGIKEFVLVRDNLECCFGPGAALYDCILVEMEEDKSAEFSIRPVAVTGVFTVQEFAPYGDTLAIYHLLADSVE